MAAKHCYKGYINNGEVGFGGEVIRPNFRKRGEYEVGDAVLWDSKSGMFRVIPQEDITTITDTTRYTPTGVIAIPSSHDVYGTKEAGVVALLSASLKTPDTGQTSNTIMAWGAFGTDYLELNDYSQCNTITSDGTNDVIGSAGRAYLPSDAFSGVGSLDGIAKYNSSTPFAPSPYNVDGSRNLDYYNTEISINNTLSDFAGKYNTEFLCSKSTKQSDWKSATSIINNTSSSISDAAGYHPAACCCWRYHTIGTNQGDWYLPAAGELGYVCARRKRINETITTLQSHLNISLCQLGTYYSYWSSSKHNYRYARYINFNTGDNGYSDRNNSSSVRPFTRLK